MRCRRLHPTPFLGGRCCARRLVAPDLLRAAPAEAGPAKDARGLGFFAVECRATGDPKSEVVDMRLEADDCLDQHRPGFPVVRGLEDGELRAEQQRDVGVAEQPHEAQVEGGGGVVASEPGARTAGELDAEVGVPDALESELELGRPGSVRGAVPEADVSRDQDHVEPAGVGRQRVLGQGDVEARVDRDGRGGQGEGLDALDLGGECGLAVEDLGLPPVVLLRVRPGQVAALVRLVLGLLGRRGLAHSSDEQEGEHRQGLSHAGTPSFPARWRDQCRRSGRTGLW